MRINILVVLIILVFSVPLTAQRIQPGLIDNIEEIYLQTNRDIYITGEEIWFRADYHLKGGQAIDLSRSLYLELVTPLGESVARHKYIITDGVATGSYPIPEGLLTATYMLRAYTQYQENYPQADFTTNLITVINPAVPLSGFEDKVSWQLRVFPEGFGIVDGHVSKVAFRVHPKMIKKLRSLQVIDQFKNMVSEVKTYDNGLGITEFLVSDSLAYTVTAYFTNGDSMYYNIPKADDLLLKSEFSDTSVKFKPFVNEPDTVSDFSIGIYDGYLLPQISQEISAKDNWQEINMNEALLASDIKYLVLRNSINEVVQVVANSQLPENIRQIEVATPHKNYRARNEVKVSFEPLGIAADNYTVSVVKKGTFEDERALLPDFIIENPQLLPVFLKNRNLQTDRFTGQLQALMLIYEHMLTENPSLFEETSAVELDHAFMPEMRGVTISGIVRHIHSARPEPSCDVYVAIIGDEPQLHVYTTNSNGEFIVSLKHVSGIQNLFLCVDSDKDDELEIMVHNDFVNKFDAFYTTPFMPDTSMRKFIEDLYVNAQLKAYTTLRDTILQEEKFYTPIRFPEASASILLDDYIALPTLREVINEIVPFVKVQKKKDVFSLEVLDRETNQLYGDPLILIDNLPVFNVNELMKIHPELIKRISVINSTYVYGEHLFRGIVFLETNTQNFAGIELPVSSTFLEFQVAENKDNFVAKKHEGVNEQTGRMPDFRNVLYWNPDVVLKDGKGQVSFSTSDYEGTYEIIVRGVDEKGNFSLGTASFTVSDK